MQVPLVSHSPEIFSFAFYHLAIFHCALLVITSFIFVNFVRLAILRDFSFKLLRKVIDIMHNIIAECVSIGTYVALYCAFLNRIVLLSGVEQNIICWNCWRLPHRIIVLYYFLSIIPNHFIGQHCSCIFEHMVYDPLLYLQSTILYCIYAFLYEALQKLGNLIFQFWQNTLILAFIFLFLKTFNEKCVINYCSCASLVSPFFVVLCLQVSSTGYFPLCCLFNIIPYVPFL